MKPKPAGADPAYMLSTATDRDRLYAQFDLFREWFGGAIERAARLAVLGPGASWRVLDVACGEGLYATEIFDRCPTACVVGVDRDPEAIATARAAFENRPGATFHVTDVHEPLVPVVGGGFDVALLVCALTHFAQGAVALRHVFEAVRPGGAVLLLDPTARMFEYPHPSLPPLREAVRRAWGRFGTYAAGDLHEALLRDAGFADVQTEDHPYVLGGTTERGQMKLTLLLELLFAMRAAVVDRARTIEADEFDRHLAALRLARHSRAEGAYFYSMALARRPP